jgi:branched-chain amino acid aminotransferase
MRKDAVADFFIVNRKLTATEEGAVFELIGDDAIYEVAKIVNGIPLFFEAHMDRMRKSARLLNDQILKSDLEIIEEIKLLTKRNRIENINAKLLWAWIGNQPTFITYFIRSEYPGETAYQEGIHVILHQGEREQPNLKTIKGSFRDKVRRARERSGAYEALLLDDGGFITEGTRSNVFFIKAGIIYTPPADTVLLGITRHQVVTICEQAGVLVKEKKLHVDDLPFLDAAFITGTTVDILPIGSIEKRRIPSTSDPQLKNIIESYRHAVQEYIIKRAR